MLYLDMTEYKESFLQLLDKKTSDVLDFNFINSVLREVLYDNPPLFIIFAKSIQISDVEIMQVFEMYK